MIFVRSGLAFVAGILARAEHFPIQDDTKIVLRCEDTTSGGNRSDLSKCQWGCYRNCLSGHVAQTDAGIKTDDITISGNDFMKCVRTLPHGCRLHGSLFDHTELSHSCTVSGIPPLGTNSSTVAMPPAVSKLYKVFVPSQTSNQHLYTHTWSPTSVVLGFLGSVPQTDCIVESTYNVEIGKGKQGDIRCQGADIAAAVASHEADDADQERSRKTVYPLISDNRLDIPLDNMNSLLVENNLITLLTETKCAVQDVDSTYLFTTGNFTLTTDARPFTSIPAMGALTLILMASCM